MDSGHMVCLLVMSVMLLSFGARRILATESIRTFLIPFFIPRVVVKTFPEECMGKRDEGAEVADAISAFTEVELVGPRGSSHWLLRF